MEDKIKMYVVNLDGEALKGGYLKIEDVDKHFVPKEKIGDLMNELEGLASDVIIFDGRRVFPLKERNTVHPETVIRGRDFVEWRKKLHKFMGL